MTITLLHPSRGRAKKAAETYISWIKKASGKHEIEHILSLDNDDNHQEYFETFSGLNTIAKVVRQVIVVSDNTCVVEATNKGAEKAKGDLIIYLSDDFECPENWDELLLEKVIWSFGGPLPIMIRVNDTIQPMDNCVLTIPIMSHSLYRRLGYFWNPEYKSMWVDVDLYFTTKPFMIECPDLLFPHLHCSAGNCEEDETYKRSSEHWNQGVEIFNRRSKEFGWGRAFNKIPV
jgi:glycosyltransferase involved in cell wall biosynthesis